MERLGDPTGDRRLRVCVAAERDGETNGRLDAVAFDEGDNRLRYRALAGDVELVAPFGLGKDVVHRAHREPDRPDSHGGPVAEASIRRSVIEREPTAEGA